MLQTSIVLGSFTIVGLMYRHRLLLVRCAKSSRLFFFRLHRVFQPYLGHRYRRVRTFVGRRRGRRCTRPPAPERPAAAALSHSISEAIGLEDEREFMRFRLRLLARRGGHGLPLSRFKTIDFAIHPQPFAIPRLSESIPRKKPAASTSAARTAHARLPPPPRAEPT